MVASWRVVAAALLGDTLFHDTIALLNTQHAAGTVKMVTFEDGELISELRDLRDVPFVNMGTPEDRMVDEILRRVVPVCGEMPVVPVAAFQNSI
ncbi:hypothetical protein [Nonomuraea sp. NPDC049784]|uniref:hypothetical protein n=1 Tax=Nonomuraea sp. NPDC049784 TaxID=3154361 RepID=UPI0033E05A18